MRRRTAGSDRGRWLAAQRAAEETHQKKARALARERRLDELAREETAAWSRVDALIATRKPAEYDATTTLVTDLQALAERNGHHDKFAHRITALRQTHARKPSLIERLDRAGM